MKRAAEHDFVVETFGLTKRFGDLTAVDHVHLRVPRGSAFGYLGPNGAGKTTLIRMLLGLTEASEGTMTLLGLDVPKNRARALSRVGAIVEEPRFHGHLSGRQNLWVIAAARDAEARGRIEPALKRVGLADRADDRVAAYSLGMRQRLGVAACLLADPELLILDEPMNGLDPAGMLEFRGLIRSFVAEGRTVVLSSHLLDEVEKTCDGVAIVDHGRVVVQGAIDDLTGDGVRRASLNTGDNERAKPVIASVAGIRAVNENGDGLTLTLSDSGHPEETVAEVVRRLVSADLPVYRVDLEQATLEERFLQVTTALGNENAEKEEL